MPDINTFWAPGASAGDWVLLGPDLASGDDLTTSILISLFTDRLADPDDAIPGGGLDRRGWWGDAGADRPIGSKLWLLERAKQTEATRLAAEDSIREALQWLLDDGVADSVDVTVQWQRAGFLAARIVVVQPGGGTSNYQWAWKGVS